MKLAQQLPVVFAVRATLARTVLCTVAMWATGSGVAGTLSGVDPVDVPTSVAKSVVSGTLGGLDSVNGFGGTIGGVDPREPLSGTTGGFDPDYRRVAVRDENSVPFLTQRGREDYRTWLTWVAPKAFAIAENGAWYGAQGAISADAAIPADPSQRALMLCEKRAKQACKLYAVDRTVVWSQDLPAAAVK